MRFVHTADWQVGMRAAHVGAAGRAVRDERIAAGRRVVDLANDRGVDFLVLAGDTFENNAVDRALVQQVADVLRAARRPVYVLPGNHDPLVAGSVWQHDAWRSAVNVTILRDASPVTVAGGTLWPCPLTAKTGRSDPTSAIAPRDVAHGIRVGVAHGELAGLGGDGQYFPMPADAASVRDVDYLAIGHWHSTYHASPRMTYSGAPEPTKFGESDSGNTLLVEIDAPGALPRITPVRTGRLQWAQWEERCVGDDAIAQVVERVERLERPNETLLSLTLGGVATPADRALVRRLSELAAARLMYARIDAAGLRPAPDAAAAWIATLPDGPLRTAAQRLTAWASSDALDRSADRPAETSEIIAARALLELYAISVEAAEATR